MNPLNHVAIIMDGNGRWGLKNRNSRNAGHKEGIKIVKKIINHSIKNNIKFLTLYAFSTENWSRPKNEIEYLFNLLEVFLKKNLRKFNEKNIKLKIIGNKNLNIKLKKILINAEEITKKNTKIQINLALNYGSKNEILDAIKKLIRDKKKINESNFNNYLYTKKIPNPDILIRTGNQKRLSNFLLWQLSYSEIFFIKKLWPDFNEKDYDQIIKNYFKIKRNFGKI